MENNKEHKIDKIFKDLLENQSFLPPVDAWTAVHTYTIGQEEAKKKVWLKYASLALLLLMLSGFGFWYFVDNQKRTSMLLTQKVVSEDTDHGGNAKNTGKSSVRTQTTALENAGRVQNPASVRTTNELTQFPLPLKHQSILLTPEMNQAENQPRNEDSLMNQNINFVESISYLTENNLEIIESKPLILNDLINKIYKENEGKIVTLEEKRGDKKEVFKIDSVNYGQKLSLKHPIISYGFGQIWNFWDMGENKFDKVVFPNERGANIQFAIAWKLNKKMRAGLTFEMNGYNLGIAAISLPPWSSSIGIPTLRLIRENQVYRSELPFGNVEIPVAYFQNAPTSIPNQLDTIRRISFSPHSMRTSSISLNFKYDLFSKLKGKKKIFNYQIYSLSDLVIQRQTSYSFVANDYYSTTSSTKPINTITVLFFDTNRLQNASEFVFGLRAGLGFRYQFARKWDFYVEGSGQHSLNNWVKSDKIKTFQRALSLQAGINLNL